MAVKNPQEVAKKWANRVANSASDYRAGVMAVREAPGAAAARAVDRMIERLIALRDSGQLQAAMQSVSLQDWQRAAVEKGADRLASGARAAEPKMQNFLAEFLPYVESVKASLPERGNMDQNIERMLANVRGMARFKRTRR